MTVLEALRQVAIADEVRLQSDLWLMEGKLCKM
jgi:hypothetical protein